MIVRRSQRMATPRGGWCRADTAVVVVAVVVLVALLLLLTEGRRLLLAGYIEAFWRGMQR